ncbi:MAG: hypothetical protein IKY90_07190 [Oscillospiraceae bacterium]|nr:hypothetical protein [Oscillospiraceae bacterium]
MTNVEKLIAFIKTLTKEQADKLVVMLPRLAELIEEPINEKEEYISAITMALYKTTDVAMLDLILQLLQKSRNA